MAGGVGPNPTVSPFSVAHAVDAPLPPPMLLPVLRFPLQRADLPTTRLLEYLASGTRNLVLALDPRVPVASAPCTRALQRC